LTPAISLYVDCKDQKEVDELWSKLTSGGGKEEPCGWLRDKFGLSWQIIPTILPQLLGHKDPATAKRAMDAMMKMKKIDIALLEKASDGR
jgi:predicted 3-demethylubiquinone-9 3-methyltransferase (glyoxalase superfamily)